MYAFRVFAVEQVARELGVRTVRAKARQVGFAARMEFGFLGLHAAIGAGDQEHFGVSNAEKEGHAERRPRQGVGRVRWIGPRETGPVAVAARGADVSGSDDLSRSAVFAVGLVDGFRVGFRVETLGGF